MVCVLVATALQLGGLLLGLHRRSDLMPVECGPGEHRERLETGARLGHGLCSGSTTCRVAGRI